MQASGVTRLQRGMRVTFRSPTGRVFDNLEVIAIRGERATLRGDFGGWDHQGRPAITTRVLALRYCQPVADDQGSGDAA